VGFDRVRMARRKRRAKRGWRRRPDRRERSGRWPPENGPDVTDLDGNGNEPEIDEIRDRARRSGKIDARGSNMGRVFDGGKGIVLPSTDEKSRISPIASDCVSGTPLRRCCRHAGELRRRSVRRPRRAETFVVEWHNGHAAIELFGDEKAARRYAATCALPWRVWRVENDGRWTMLRFRLLAGVACRLPVGPPSGAP
jgi:hypothetical protein